MVFLSQYLHDMEPLVTMTQTALEEIRDKISLASKDKHNNNKKMFLKNWFEEEKRGHPIYVMRFELGENQFGNTVGIYMDEIACALKSHSHVVVIPLNFNRDFHDESSKGANFMRSLSTVYVHPDPAANSSQALAWYKMRCSCSNQQCWERRSPPWIDHIDVIRRILNRALSAESFDSQIRSGGDYFTLTSEYNGKAGRVPQKMEISENTTVVVKESTDLHVLDADYLLPLVPTVIIQFRCSDNFKTMGMTPLAAMFDRMDGLGLGKGDSIFLATEHPKRLHGGVKRLLNLCPTMINFMQSELAHRYPGVVVSIRRGQILQTWYQFNKAKTVFCAASTFAIWPALANPEGTVYYPGTRILGSGHWHLEAHNVTNVHLIDDYDLVSFDETSTISDLEKQLLLSKADLENIEREKKNVSIFPSSGDLFRELSVVNDGHAVPHSLSLFEETGSGSAVTPVAFFLLLLLLLFSAPFSTMRRKVFCFNRKL